MDTLRRLSDVLYAPCHKDEDAALIKKKVQDIYSVNYESDNDFINYGYYDKTLEKEFKGLDIDLPKYCNHQNISSPMLIYYLIKPFVNKNQHFNRVLDIGCGNGMGLKLMSELLNVKKCIGLDITPEKINHAAKNTLVEDNIICMQADAEKIPLKDNQIDIVTNVESSHLYPQIEHFFSEVFRVLCVDGYFSYTDFDTDIKDQKNKFSQFLEKNKSIRLIKKENITKKVQAAVFQNMVLNEAVFCKRYFDLFEGDEERFNCEIPNILSGWGALFLPKMKQCLSMFYLKNKIMRDTFKTAIRTKLDWKPSYFYYLVQKK